MRDTFSNRRILLSSVVGLISLLAGCGQGMGRVDEQRFHDGGPVFTADGETVEHTFRVLNRKTVKLTINKLTRSCNCTDAHLSAMSIDPGAAVELSMKVKPSPGLGNWDVSCTIETDDPEEPERTYKINYRTYPHVRFDPVSVSLGTSGLDGAGRRPPARRSEAWFEVFEKTSDRADAFGRLETPSRLVGDVDRVPIVDRLEGGRITRSRYRIGVDLSPTSSDLEGSSGVHSATISASTRLNRSTTLAVIWSLDRPLQVSPDPVSFGVIKRSVGRAKRNVLFKSLDSVPFRLLSIASDLGEVDVDNSRGVGAATLPKSSHIVEFDFKVKGSEGSYPSGRIRVATDHPRMPTVTIPWSAILRD